MPDTPPQTTDDFWKQRARQARERRERLMSFGPNVRGLYIETPEGFFVLDPEDGFIGTALLTEGFHNDWEYKILQSAVSKDSDALVVGAHIGTHAVRLSRHCRNLIAIEANPRTFRFLQSNLLLNQCSNVTAYGVAASDKPEKIRFLMGHDNTGSSKRMPQTVLPAYIYDNPDMIEIEAQPLDTLLGPRGFELILMDIEGSEYFALKGMQQILAKSKTLSMEFMPHMIKNVANASADDLFALLTPHFQWLCVPRHNCAYPHAEIAQTLRSMYAAGENHEGIFFIKDPLPQWLLRRQTKA